MSVLYLVLPLALMFACGAVIAFAWTVRSGQLDDVDTPPRRILFDDERKVSAPAAGRNGCDGSGELSQKLRALGE
jgi:cbb3-type cytochrome oxidase maturation protein